MSHEDPGEGIELEIKNADNFAQLYEALKKAGKLVASESREYSAEELIRRIEEARERLDFYAPEEIPNFIPEDSPERAPVLDTITRTSGLRKRVGELILKEHLGDTTKL